MWTVEKLARDLADGITSSRELTEMALARVADPAVARAVEGVLPGRA